MTSIKLDLNYVYNNGTAVDNALQQAFDEAIEKKIREVELTGNKADSQLIKKIERFLQQPHIKKCYHRLENDSKRSGKLHIYFKY
jgi:hypothetical protein